MLVIPSGKLGTLKVLKYCPTCYSGNPDDVGAIVSKTVTCCDHYSIVKAAFPLPHEGLRWNLVFKAGSINLLNLMVMQTLKRETKNLDSFR